MFVVLGGNEFLIRGKNGAGGVTRKVQSNLLDGKKKLKVCGFFHELGLISLTTGKGRGGREGGGGGGGREEGGGGGGEILLLLKQSGSVLTINNFPDFPHKASRGEGGGQLFEVRTPRSLESFLIFFKGKKHFQSSTTFFCFYL